MKPALRAAGIFWLTAALALAVACSDSPPQTQGGTEAVNSIKAETAEAPLVTLKHWRDSTPGERYSFLIGFVTMLELEKEWQGRIGGRILPFEQSLIESWTIGFAKRPISEIYNGLNKYLGDHPGELDRPVAEVMWFIYVKPRLGAREKDGNQVGDESPDLTNRTSPQEGP